MNQKLKISIILIIIVLTAASLLFLYYARLGEKEALIRSIPSATDEQARLNREKTEKIRQGFAESVEGQIKEIDLEGKKIIMDSTFSVNENEAKVFTVLFTDKTTFEMTHIEALETEDGMATKFEEKKEIITPDKLELGSTIVAWTGGMFRPEEIDQITAEKIVFYY